mmetsp:Transcript_118143/g.208935  ORF Transcript_118143/g.208935 Transcript_118143/m.208935 type:complete len:781 (-) Transcript_118143:145-2487(-)
MVLAEACDAGANINTDARVASPGHVVVGCTVDGVSHDVALGFSANGSSRSTAALVEQTLGRIGRPLHSASSSRTRSSSRTHSVSPRSRASWASGARTPPPCLAQAPRLAQRPGAAVPSVVEARQSPGARRPSSSTASPCGRNPEATRAREERSTTPPTACRHLTPPRPLKVDLEVASALQRIDACTNDIGLLRKAQEQMGKRHEEAEVIRRGQIDSISERVFQVERKLRQAEEEQQDAIEKANMTFQKQYAEVQKDRHNLMSAITQVNQNFDRVSCDMGEQRNNIASLQQSFAFMQQNHEWAAADIRKQSDVVGVLQQSCSQLEQMLQAQKQQIQELHVATQAIHDTILQTTPQSSFMEAEERHRKLAENFHEVHERVLSLASQMAQVHMDAELMGTPRSKPNEVHVQVVGRPQPQSGSAGSEEVPSQPAVAETGTSTPARPPEWPGSGGLGTPHVSSRQVAAEAGTPQGRPVEWPSSGRGSTVTAAGTPTVTVPTRRVLPPSPSPSQQVGSSMGLPAAAMPDMTTHASGVQLATGSMKVPCATGSGSAKFPPPLAGSLQIPLGGPAVSAPLSPRPGTRTPLAGGGTPVAGNCETVHTGMLPNGTHTSSAPGMLHLNRVVGPSGPPTPGGHAPPTPGAHGPPTPGGGSTPTAPARRISTGRQMLNPGFRASDAAAALAAAGVATPPAMGPAWLDPANPAMPPRRTTQATSSGGMGPMATPLYPQSGHHWQGPPSGAFTPPHAPAAQAPYVQHAAVPQMAQMQQPRARSLSSTVRHVQSAG